MTDFYVSFMKPIKRARIHKSECSNCNRGQGQLGQDKTGSGATGWSGAMSRQAAVELAQSYIRQGYKDVAFCGTCLRGEKLSLRGDKQENRVF